MSATTGGVSLEYIIIAVTVALAALAAYQSLDDGFAGAWVVRSADVIGVDRPE